MAKLSCDYRLIDWKITVLGHESSGLIKNQYELYNDAAVRLKEYARGVTQAGMGDVLRGATETLTCGFNN